MAGEYPDLPNFGYGVRIDPETVLSLIRGTPQRRGMEAQIGESEARSSLLSEQRRNLSEMRQAELQQIAANVRNLLANAGQTEAMTPELVEAQRATTAGTRAKTETENVMRQPQAANVQADTTLKGAQATEIPLAGQRAATEAKDLNIIRQLQLAVEALAAASNVTPRIGPGNTILPNPIEGQLQGLASQLGAPQQAPQGVEQNADPLAQTIKERILGQNQYPRPIGPTPPRQPGDDWANALTRRIQQLIGGLGAADPTLQAIQEQRKKGAPRQPFSSQTQ